MNNKIITLDLTDCRYLGEIHQRIQKAFDFPNWYGATWSSFWDLLWSECDAEMVEIVGESTLSQDLLNEISNLHKALDDKIVFNQSHNLDKFSYRIMK